jgi:hypothetical protein
MAINKTLVWILAGGAALALGGAAIWWWRRRAKAKARSEQIEPDPDPGQDIPPITDPLDLEAKAVPREQSETRASRTPPARGPVEASRGPELEPALGDDAAFTETTPDVEPRHTAEVIEPPTVFVPKSRRKRYRIGVGDLIELRPDTSTALPLDSAWQPSRADVAVRVVEQDQARSVVALDGPAGEVNIALQTPVAAGKVRTLCSWKFQIVEKAA